MYRAGLDIKDLFSRPGAPAYPFKDNRDQLCWLEPLTEEGGRVALKQLTGDAERIVTPPGFQLRSRVHEYGGRCFCVVGEQVYFNHYADGLLYRQHLHDNTPPVAVLATNEAASQYADLVYSEALHAVLAVQEIQGQEGTPNSSQLVVLTLASSLPLRPRVVARGADFYAAPCVSPQGDQIAWLEWDNPHMPWDSSRLMCAGVSSIDAQRVLVEPAKKIAGGESQSVCQPGFLSSGELVFAMDRDAPPTAKANFWNLYLADHHGIRALTQDCMEYGEAHWVFGQHRWVQTSPSQLLAVATHDETDQLFEIDVISGSKRKRGGRYARLSQLSMNHGAVCCIAEYTDQPAAIIALKPGLSPRVLKPGTAWLGREEISQPQYIACQTRDGGQAYANFYPACSSGPAPLGLLVKVHGGPTSRATTSLSPLVQYFAQNGFAVLDINHRGSTGHGRAYRQSLLGQWGEIDADDIADTIQYVVAEHGLDPAHVFIRGGSAGGYAVLRALTRFPELFCGGACYYGIGNLITLAEITHKFEGCYTDQLIGEPYDPDMAAMPRSRFRTRSPIFDIENIRSPLILFQGLEDRVVPPEVSREMVRTLEQNGVRHAYVEYPEEGHGFRQAATKIDALSREIAFYREILETD